MSEKFICFGCWNNLNDGKGNLNKVMHSLQTYISNESPEDKTERIIVAGDNYYPDKIVDGKNKRKVLYPEKLAKGFNLLPKDIPINMIMGNHDYETNLKKPSIFVNNEVEENGNCEITNLEMSSVAPNIDLHLFKSIYSNKTKTLLLMIDTSIYSDDAEDFLKCYNVFLHNQFSSVSDLEEYQNNLIFREFELHKDELNKIIIVGHHPITGFKYKEKEKEGVIKKKVELMNDIPKFIPVLEQIYKPGTKYYYLCADYHSYQHGYITLANGMEIEQYIAGTGGTELDLDLPSNDEKTDTTNNITYRMPANGNVKNWGFLVCRVTLDMLACEPIFVNAGGKKKQNTQHKKRKNKKRSLKKYRK